MNHRKDIFKKLSQTLKTPKQVQAFLYKLEYNREKGGETLRSAASALAKKQAHCFEAALIAAAILECHGYPPQVLSFESQDGLDHVIYVFKKNNKWGAIARSRDEGLHGRPAHYRSLRDLTWSYFDPYVDKVGKITAYQLAQLDDTKTDWRASTKNVWKAETYLLALKHISLKSSKKRYKKLLASYLKNGPMKRQKHWW